MKAKKAEELSQFCDMLLQRFPEAETFVAAADTHLKNKIDPAYDADSRGVLFRIMHKAAATYSTEQGTAETHQIQGRTEKAGLANERAVYALETVGAMLKDIGSIYKEPAKRSTVMADLGPVLTPKTPVLGIAAFLGRPDSRKQELVA